MWSVIVEDYECQLVVGFIVGVTRHLRILKLKSEGQTGDRGRSPVRLIPNGSIKVYAGGATRENGRPYNTA
ncbi:MAG: hypothetical protein FWG68_09655 [Defluviitaleaceae bacterium]|nr:hypothetical protein [Defluviitaleaceae bacterium]